jgi:hypothetical protein
MEKLVDAGALHQDLGEDDKRRMVAELTDATGQLESYQLAAGHRLLDDAIHSVMWVRDRLFKSCRCDD